MKNNHNALFVSWPNLAIITGGLLMAALWIIYTYVHGPTSFDRDRSVLGQSTLFWGSMMNAPGSILISLGLLAQYALLAGRIDRKARIGFVITLIGLALPAVVDLVMLWLGPPLLFPLVGGGLVLLGLSHRKTSPLPKSGQMILLGLGILMCAMFLWALIPNEISDRIYGYRIFGFMAYFMFGLGWAIFGTILWRFARQAR